MATVAEWVKVDGERAMASLEEAQDKLGGAHGELVLDFTALRRIDGPALAALEKLTNVADEKKIKLVLRGVGVDIYKVLVLARLTPRLTFLN